MILDGKTVASEIYTSLQKEIEPLEIKPILGAILVGDQDSPSLRYIKQKRRETKKIGMGFSLLHLPADISEDALISEIEKFNVDKSISGYIVQLPLPRHIDTLRVIESIAPKKDADGFHPENQGKIMIGDPSGFSPCTPAGVMELFTYYNIPLKGKHVVILGRSNIVGKPLTQMCISEGATVTNCNSHTPDISIYTNIADVVVCATGQKHILKADMISKNCVVIDVGFSVEDGEIYGDADTQGILAQGNAITPVPGGVGPMTVAMLLSNTLKAHSMRND